MDKLLEQAKKFLQENMNINEVELSDGFNKVRIVRNAPFINVQSLYPQQYWGGTWTSPIGGWNT
jgi:hypothetical protein